MEDFMDSLVKEVEGNVKPIRSVRLRDSDDSQTVEKPAKEDGRDIFLHVHRENVKCYRNTQAVVSESSDRISREMKNGRSGIRGLLIAVLILTIVNLGASAFLILRMVFGIV